MSNIGLTLYSGSDKLGKREEKRKGKGKREEKEK
jgi:hypothetical protein